MAIIKVVITRIFQDARHFLFQRLNNGHVVFPLHYWVGRPTTGADMPVFEASRDFPISSIDIPGNGYMEYSIPGI